MAGLTDRRRARSCAGALLEMSALANEKERLHQELAAAQRRRQEIETRLDEIAEKQRRLQQFISTPRDAAASALQAKDTGFGLKVTEVNY